jgi:hypothetical protein
VFETIYSRRTNLYFWAYDGDLPFSRSCAASGGSKGQNEHLWRLEPGFYGLPVSLLSDLLLKAWAMRRLICGAAGVSLRSLV